MSLAPLVFTGISSYSADFQTILDRAVAIASIPLQSLQNEQADILSKKVLVSNLSASAATMATRLSALGEIGKNKALVATSSNTAKVTALNTGASSAATFTISEVTSIAKAASETSILSYASSTETQVATTPDNLKLTVGSKTYTLDISGNNSLVGLRDAINKLNAGVTATILTVSPTENYLSVTANAVGATTLTLVDDPDGTPVQLLTSLNQGGDTVFKLNGVTVSKPTTQINDVIPGLVLNILQTTAADETITVQVGTDRSKISNALRDLVSAYNAAVDQVNQQVGESAGLLSGDFLVRNLQESLRQVAGYRGSGLVQGLADLGVEFDSTGKASFNQTTFDQLSEAHILSAFEFLGSETTGLGALAKSFTAISDPVTGLAKLQQDQYDATDRYLSNQIAVLVDRINQMQQGLADKLYKADALIGQLESNQLVIDASIKGLQLVLFGKSKE